MATDEPHGRLNQSQTVNDNDSKEDEDVLKVADVLVAVALGMGIVDYFEETIDDTQRARYRSIIIKARKSASNVSNQNNMDIYECVKNVQSVLRGNDVDANNEWYCSSVNKSTTCSLL